MLHKSVHLEGLERLSRERGVDTRATILRVATDLFATAPHRTPADVERFAALALPLIDVADHATRIVVARRLAPLADAPAAVLERLLNDHVEISREILLHAPGLNPDSRMSVAIDGGPAEASALAERADLDRGTARALSAHPSRQVAETLVANAKAPLDNATLSNLVERSRRDPDFAALLLKRPDVDASLCASLYPMLGTEDRRRVRLAMILSGVKGVAPLDPEALLDFRIAVARGGDSRFAAGLSLLLKASPVAIEPIVSDPTGEMPALALIACGFDREEMTAALLMCGSEAVRTSIPKIFAAASLHDEVPRTVALAILRASVSGSTAQSRPVHAPHLDPSEAPARAPHETRRANVSADVRGLRQRPQGS